MLIHIIGHPIIDPLGQAVAESRLTHLHPGIARQIHHQTTLAAWQHTKQPDISNAYRHFPEYRLEAKRIQPNPAIQVIAIQKGKGYIFKPPLQRQ